MSMNRPIYESEEDRVNEQALADYLAERHDLLMYKMPIKLHLDYFATRGGRGVGFFEMRRRKVNMHQYDTMMLGMHKIQSAHNLTAATGLPCFFVVQWNDAKGICRIPPEEHVSVRWDWGGHNNRNDPQDMEPVAYWDISAFKELK